MASKAVKILLIGCGVIVILGIIAIGVGGYFVKNWFSEKGKTWSNIAGTKDSNYGKKTAELSKAYPFTPPADGVVTEEQLNRFLAVRKEIYSVYKQHEAEFKKLEDSKDQGLSAIMKLGNLWQEIRMTQASALEKQKMSPEEYGYVVTAVYKTWFAKGAKEAMKHETFTEASQDGLKQSIAELDKKLQDPNTSEDEKKVLQKTKETLEAQLNSVSENQELKRMDAELQSVPKENIELFTKHQKEIQDYSMGGLEFIGL